MRYKIVGRQSWLKLATVSVFLAFFITSYIFDLVRVKVLDLAQQAGGRELGLHLRIIADHLLSADLAIASALILTAMWSWFLAKLPFVGKKIVVDELEPEMQMIPELLPKSDSSIV